MRPVLFLVAALLASRAFADGVQLAPARHHAEETAMPAEARLDDLSWKLCRTKVSGLLSAPGATNVAFMEESAVYLGEALDVSRDVPVKVAGGQALLRVRIRIRAALAREGGVTYLVTSEGVLASAIGFESDDVGKEQVREAMMVIADSGAHLHEILALPAIGVRLVAAVSARPIFGREGESILASLRPRAAELHRFHVEAFARSGEKLTLLEETELSALEGRPVAFALSQLGTRGKMEVPEALKHGASVRLVEPRTVGDTGYRDGHGVVTRPADSSFQVENTVEMDNAYFEANEVKADPSDDPKHFTQRRKSTKKMSDRKRAQLVEQQKVLAVRAHVIEQSKKLPGGAAVPEGFRREELRLELTPLAITASTVRLELGVRGFLRLPDTEEPILLATTFIEHLPVGEGFDIALAELAGRPRSPTDVILRITPQP